MEARLVNVSREGELMECKKLPGPDTPVSLRMESPVKTDWVDATIVRVDPNRQIGLRFTQGCPDDLLLAGTRGHRHRVLYFAMGQISRPRAIDQADYLNLLLTTLLTSRDHISGRERTLWRERP